jgi:hypothetical protein
VPAWLVVVLALVALLALLAIGGGIANARRERATRPGFDESLRDVDRALAAALASDRGWEPAGLEAAARRELAGSRPGEDVVELSLAQVLDRPGTDSDEAVFRARLAKGGQVSVRLVRRGDEWQGAGIEDSALS